ncbi:MerR family transcriptional regulator [Agromyces neolithicus]
MIDATAGGAPRAPLRTSDVAHATGYSVQQVRDLERLGVIPPATRSPNGYRSYAPIHVHALGAYRGIAAAIGAVAARRLLTELREQTVTEAAAAVTSIHAGLARERDEALRAQAALHAIQAEGSFPDGEAADDAMTITELAAALGVRASTLRFWEQEGLVTPDRVTSLRARRYGLAAIRQARIVAALRSSGYGIPAVSGVMSSLDGLGGVAEAERMLQHRLDQIGGRSVALLRASADLAAVVSAPAG